MKRKLLRFFSLAVGLLVLCGNMFAHHGYAAFDEQKIIVLKNATVTQFLWANPHVLTFFDVRDDNGQITHWTVESGSPQGVKPMGWSRNSLKPGDVITLYVHQSKKGDPVGIVEKIVLADGTALYGPGKGPANDKKE